MKLTASFGAANTVTGDDFTPGLTVGQFRKHPKVQAGLGLGDNVEARVDGSLVNDTQVLWENARVTFSNRSCSKAS